MGFLVAHNGARIFGGCEKWTARTLSALQARGHTVRLFCNHELVRDRTQEYGVPAEIVMLRGDVLLTDAIGFGLKLRRARPDALLFTTFKKTWLGSLALPIARVPNVVVRVGLSSDVPRRWKYNYALRRVDYVAVNASEIRPLFIDAAPDFDPARVVIIENGVKAPAVTNTSLRLDLGLPSDAIVIGTVARLTNQKRINVLIAAVAELPERVHCIIAGDGGRRADLEEQATSLGVRDRVHFLGQRDNVGDVLQALDVFVLPSGREGMSNAMLEAMAAGVPVVITPVTGAAAVGADTDDPAGIVLQGFDAAELTAALKLMTSDAAKRARMSAAARRRHSEHYTFERMIDQWEALLFERRLP